MNRLGKCDLTGHRWNTVPVLDDHKEVLGGFLSKADKCTSVKEIWGLEAGNVSLFYYTNTLATWFFGLNLVRFEERHFGRSLEIYG